MKYLKGTLVLFVATFLFAVVDVKAGYLGIAGAEIPIFSGSYTSSQREKYNDTYQYVKKVNCLDDYSGDARAVMAKARGMYAGMTDSSWVETVKGSNVSLGSNSRSIGGWRLMLKSKKSLPTTASFTGEWLYE